jgi:hypothetical protein
LTVVGRSFDDPPRVESSERVRPANRTRGDNLPEIMDCEVPLEAQQQQAVLNLPDAPAFEDEEVKAWDEPVEMLSYLPAAPDRNPMFFEKRVYQGSSGDVYPLPLIDSIACEPVMKSWKAIHIENSYVRLMILPEIGGRIHVGLDKINGYDFFTGRT